MLSAVKLTMVSVIMQNVVMLSVVAPFENEHQHIMLQQLMKKQVGNNCNSQAELFDPELPEDKVEVIDTVQMGTVNKIFLEFESPFWDLENPGAFL